MSDLVATLKNLEGQSFIVNIRKSAEGGTGISFHRVDSGRYGWIEIFPDGEKVATVSDSQGVVQAWSIEPGDDTIKRMSDFIFADILKGKVDG